MTNSFNDMIITNSSLSQISRELIDQRVYENGTINISGNPVIVNGVAAGLNSNNYFYHNNLSFNESVKKVVITFSGTYRQESEDMSCAWELIGDNSPNISLCFDGNDLKLLKGSEIISQFPNLTVNLENQIKTTVSFINVYSENNITAQNCVLSVVYNGEYKETSVALESIISFSNYSTVFLGNSSNTLNPWQGNVNLADFAIYQDNIILYSSSVRNSFKFEYLLLGDGTVPLTDESEPILDHIYKCEFSNEISRTNNHILLTTTIPKNAYLNIVEIGLYYKDDTGTHIFSKIDNLLIKKSSDLTYDLIIHINLEINVVNTTIVPEIIVNTPDYIKSSDFFTVKQVHAYIAENMERIVRLNSLGIGNYKNGISVDKESNNFLPLRPLYNSDDTYGVLSYLSEIPNNGQTRPVGVGINKPQAIYRGRRDLSFCIDEFFSAKGYANLKRKLTPTSTEVFNKDAIQEHGNVNVDENGVATLFSNINYVESGVPFSISSEDSWNINVRFKTPLSVNSTLTILSLNGEYINQPFLLQISNGNLNLTIKGRDTIVVLDTSTNTSSVYYRKSVTVMSDTKYYRWTNGTNNILTTVFDNLTSSTPFYNESGVQQSNLQFSSQEDTSIYNDTIANVLVGTNYTVNISYKNSIYTVEITNETNRSILAPVTFTSYYKINNTETTYFGIQGSGTGSTSNPFAGGSIFLKDTYFETATYDKNAVLIYSSKVNYTTTINKYANLLDFFYLPEYERYYYKILNLGLNQTSYLSMFNGEFTGTYDRINFMENPQGFTLCVKAFLKNSAEKMILAKRNPEAENPYFVLEQKDNKLIFTLNLNQSSIKISREISTEEFSSFFEQPINITIVCNGNRNSPVFTMYRNNEVIGTAVLPEFDERSVTWMKLTNYLTENSAPKDRIIYNILSIDGAVTTEDLYAINTVLNTNF